MTKFLFKQNVSHVDFIKSRLSESFMPNIVYHTKSIFERIPDRTNYNLVFIGPVGVGKSTLCTLLYHLLDRSFNESNIDVYCYPEFLQIEPAIGHDVLKQHLEGHLTSFQLQKYILTCWDKMMSAQPIPFEAESKRINIFERCCDDSVICFANVWNQRDPTQLSDSELFTLFQMARELDVKYQIPNYFVKPERVHFTILHTATLDILIHNLLSIMDSDIKNGITTRFIGLYANINTLTERITNRGRPGESSYKPADISAFHAHYSKLYDHLEDHGRIDRFLDIGSLVKPYE